MTTYGEKLNLNLSINDVIVPRSVCLAFEIEIKGKDANSAIYQKINYKKKKIIIIRFSCNEVMSIDDSDIQHCYLDL